MLKSRIKLLNNSCALLAGAFLAATALLFLLLREQTGQPALSLICGVIFCAGWAASHKLVNSLVAPRLSRLPLKIRIAWLATCLAFGSVWSILLCADVPIPHQLEITAEGKKNNISMGNEVWLLSRKHDFSRNFDIHHFQEVKGWEERDMELAAWNDFPAVLRWRGQLPFPGQLFFLTHDYSGKVIVSWDGVAREYDLYSKQRGVLRVTLPKTGSIRRWPAFQFCLAMVLAFVLVNVSVGLFIPGAPGDGDAEKRAGRAKE